MELTQRENNLLIELYKEREMGIWFKDSDIDTEEYVMNDMVKILNSSYNTSEFSSKTEIGDIIATKRFGDLAIYNIAIGLSPMKHRQGVIYYAVDKSGKTYNLKLNRKNTY